MVAVTALGLAVGIAASLTAAAAHSETLPLTFWLTVQALALGLTTLLMLPFLGDPAPAPSRTVGARTERTRSPPARRGRAVHGGACRPESSGGPVRSQRRGRRGSDQQIGVLDGDREPPRLSPAPDAGAYRLRFGGQLELLLARGPHPPGEPLRASSACDAPSRQGLGRTRTVGAEPAEFLDGDRDGIGPSRRPRSVRRRWWPSNAAADAPIQWICRGQLTRPTTDNRQRRPEHPACAQTATGPGELVLGQHVQHAEAVIRVALGESPCAAGRCRSAWPSTVTAAPSAAGPGRSAAAISSRSASRSCTTQCWGRGSSGAQPAAHRAGTAAEVVDHPAAARRRPRAARRRARAHGPQRRRARAGRATLLTRGPLASSRRRAQDIRDDGCGARPSGRRLTPLTALRANVLSAPRHRARPGAPRRVPQGRPG